MIDACPHGANTAEAGRCLRIYAGNRMPSLIASLGS